MSERKTTGNDKLHISMFGQKAAAGDRSGGIEVVVDELSKRMVALGNEVICYNRSTHHISGKEFDRERITEHKGVKQKYVPTIEKKGLAAVTSSFFAALFSAFKDYDVVHIHAEGPAAFCWIPRLMGKKVVVTIHGLDWQREKWQGSFGSKYIHLGEKMAVKYAHEIIVLSKSTQQYFRNTYGRETRFIPNGVTRPELAAPDLIKKKFGLDKDTYILYVGRIVPEKGEHYLVKAFRDVKTEKKLVIAGGTSDTDRYMKQLRKLAAGDERIIFTGFVHGKLLQELFSNAYVYTLPSDLEGMPLSLLEGMSYGNCCLVSDISECSDIVGDHAVTFKKSDVADLKEKLQELCDDKNKVKSYKIKASDYICGKYDWDNVVNQTIDLYKK